MFNLTDVSTACSHIPSFISQVKFNWIIEYFQQFTNCMVKIVLSTICHIVNKDKMLFIYI